MAEPSILGFRRENLSDILAAAAIILIIVIMIVRLPPGMLDAFIAVNISISLLILMVSFYIRQPLDFSSFPTVLLITTIFRLALNITSTKLILGESNLPPEVKAGSIIRFFGQIVAAGDVVVGFVVFIILIVVQFVVITKGAGRVAEVAARFTLDAMPGKQMAIDADLNAGLITEDQARERRQRIGQEADFYGAMDGASKFVRGDAIAGIIITIINIIGGIARGLAEGLGLSATFETYTILTIGDGLVSQIPSILIATAAGVVVTRAASEVSLGANLAEQFSSRFQAIFLAAGALGLLALYGLVTVPGITLPFLIIAGVIAFIGFQALRREERREAEEERAAVQEEAAAPPAEPEEVERLLTVDTMEITIGYALVPVVDVDQGGDLLERVGGIRRRMATELGIIVPPVRIRDDLQLSPNVYVIKIKGIRVGQGEVLVDRLLAMNPGDVTEQIPGIETTEPTFGLPARWIHPEDRTRSERLGYSVIEPTTVIATHLAEIIKRHAADLLGRQEVQSLIDNLRETNPVVVDELIPGQLGIGPVQKVLQNLLREQVSIRNLVTILEALADYAPQTRDPDALTEFARMALARHITQQYADDINQIHVITLDPRIEQTILDTIRRSQQAQPVLDPSLQRHLIDQLTVQAEQVAGAGHTPIVLTNPQIRLYLRRLIQRFLPQVIVLSYNEITTDARVMGVGTVALNEGEEVRSR